MSKIRVPFGWLPEKTTWEGPEFKIEPLPEIDDAIQDILESPQVADKWCYPPIVEGPPERPGVTFSLPLTHSLELVEEVDTTAKLSTLVLHVLGLLKGMQLFPAPWSRLYRVPVK